jgi:nucleotide-binding universal stress UspA family protein
VLRLILVPLDGTPFAEHAVPAAIALARPGRGRLLLAHVRTDPWPFGGGAATDAASLADPPMADGLEEAACAYLRDAARRIAARTDVPSEWVILHGDVPNALDGLARHRAADLVVMASHDRSALGRLFAGSVAERVVHETGLPVLLVRKSDAQLALERERDPEAVADPIRLPAAPYRHVLVPLDGSPLAEAVLEPAVRVARASGAAVTLATVRHPAGDGARRDYLDHVARWLSADGLTVDVHEVEGTHVARAILQVATDVSADLIAMTTHGRRTLARLVQGSVAADVLHAVLMAVLLVRPELGAARGG